jgi:hypothetical protein
MGIDTEIMDIKGFEVCGMDDDGVDLATLCEALPEFESNKNKKLVYPGEKDAKQRHARGEDTKFTIEEVTAEYYGIDSFNSNLDSLKKAILTLPHPEHLTTVPYFEEKYYTSIGWESFNSKSRYDPTDADLAALKQILIDHGYTLDGRIPGDRAAYQG